MSIPILLPESLHREVLAVGERTEAVAAISELVRRELLRKRRQYWLLAEHLEKKYHVTFEEFERTAVEASMPYHIEQDYFDWDMARTVIDDIDANLANLEIPSL
jgi:hypothetical protein